MAEAQPIGGWLKMAPETSNEDKSMTYFVKPAYYSKKGVPKLAIYFQAEPMRMPDGKMVTPKAIPVVIAANYLSDPATVLGAMVDVLNGKQGAAS